MEVISAYRLRGHKVTMNDISNLSTYLVCVHARSTSGTKLEQVLLASLYYMPRFMLPVDRLHVIVRKGRMLWHIDVDI